MYDSGYIHTCCSKPSISCKALSAFCRSTLANMTMAPRVLSVSTHLLMSTELHWPFGLHVRSAKLPSLLWLEEQRTSLVMSCSVLGHIYPWKNWAKQQPSQTSPYIQNMIAIQHKYMNTIIWLLHDAQYVSHTYRISIRCAIPICVKLAHTTINPWIFPSDKEFWALYKWEREVISGSWQCLRMCSALIGTHNTCCIILKTLTVASCVYVVRGQAQIHYWLPWCQIGLQGGPQKGAAAQF